MTSPDSQERPDPHQPARPGWGRFPLLWQLSLVLVASGLAAQTTTAAETAESQQPSTGVVEAAEGGSDAGTEPDQRKAGESDKKKPARKLKRKEIKALTAQLPEQHRQWLLEVHWLISAEERQAFLQLEKDYQRDAFIERFWRTRDRFTESATNEFRDQWYERLHYASQEFGDLMGDRARMFLLNGPPTARVPFRCSGTTWPLEIWYYKGSERVSYEFFLLFYKKWGGQRMVLWRSGDGIRELMDMGASAGGGGDFFQDVYTCKDGDFVAGVLRRLLHPSYQMDYSMLLGKIERPRETPDGEWIETFESYSTDIPEDAGTFEAKVSLDYTERYQSRTVMDGLIEVDPAGVEAAELGGHKGYNFLITGEILREASLFDQFRYRFDLPAIGDGPIPLVFQRRLRPGNYRLVVKVEDLNSKAFFRHEADIEVPFIDSDIASLPDDPETRKILEDAHLVIGNDIPTIQLVEPQGTMQVGMVRFDTLVTGKGIEEVRFALNDRVVLQKRRPPFSVELDLGSVPRTHDVRVSAHDAEGNELTSDELTLNAGEHQFQVHLVEPRDGVTYTDHVDVDAKVLTPEGRPIERVEVYLNEDLIATLYQEPWTQRVQLQEPGQLAYVRAVAYLPDDNSTDDLVYINAPDYLENLDIEFVELYASVLDRSDRPLLGLDGSQFTILEDGVEQTVARFDKVTNLPIHAQVVVDVSASMEDNIDTVQQAALQFFEDTVRPKDRASLVTFNDHPYLSVKFTNEIAELAGGLAGLKAERGTALWDAMVFGLYYMNGLKGQKAILLLSDGKDEVSRFSFEQTLEYARRAGVSVYSIGLGIEGKDSRVAKKALTELAEETGGRSFFIKEVSELAAIYAAIQQELRSRYLIAYQSSNSSSNGKFRSIELRVDVPGAKAKTLSGYYP